MTSWFRSWHGAAMDPKWLMIAQEAKVKPIIVVGVMWALMDHASQAEDRGNVEKFCFKSFAAFTCVTSDEVVNVLDSLRDNGIIVDNRLKSWEKRQPKREDNSTARVEAHREKKRIETQCNAVETRGNSTDTDTDTKRKKKVVDARGTRLPQTFQPDMQFAMEKGMPRSRAKEESEKFRNHFLAAPGQKGVKKDWPATWRNWVLNSPNFNRSQPNGGQKSMATIAQELADASDTSADYGSGDGPLLDLSAENN